MAGSSIRAMRPWRSHSGVVSSHLASVSILSEVDGLANQPIVNGLRSRFVGMVAIEFSGELRQ